MPGQRFLVQASSRSWSGGLDHCMRPVNGKPAVYHTVVRIREHFPSAAVTIVAPAFDEGGKLEEALRPLQDSAVRITYGHDGSPMLRMRDQTAGMRDDEVVVRVDGLNLFFHVGAVREMLAQVASRKLDMMKLPDDYPPMYAAEVFRVHALRRLADRLSAMGDTAAAPHHVHPRFLMMRLPGLRTAYLEPCPTYSDKELLEFRRAARTVYNVPREDVTGLRIPAGDQLSFHYEWALRHLRPDDRVLDIASGDGYGAALAAGRAASVVAADADAEVVAQGAARWGNVSNLSFRREEGTSLSLADASFDCVLSMETVEHVPQAERFVAELARVTRPGGRLILSTPQSAMGSVPMNDQHVREYSLAQLRELLERHWRVEQLLGLKGGRIWFDDDPIGTNSLVLARRA
jgi:2-polyprenyl-3-methyl-5-hydroxy-6-metoxy-1,4-benzoquinol methylase/spore coat polysaccharide biosynthesis protein SpsF (cytidylyltransferase family)